jgi:hypothetical protein
MSEDNHRANVVILAESPHYDAIVRAHLHDRGAPSALLPNPLLDKCGLCGFLDKPFKSASPLPVLAAS